MVHMLLVGLLLWMKSLTNGSRYLSYTHSLHTHHHSCQYTCTVTQAARCSQPANQTVWQAFPLLDAFQHPPHASQVPASQRGPTTSTKQQNPGTAVPKSHPETLQSATLPTCAT
jgi:hypothetical protein